MNGTKFVIAGLLGAVSAAGAAELVIAEFDIHDHPQGNLLPPSYALRMDNVFGAFNATFSADIHNDATLTVIQDTVTNDLYIDIVGTFHGGEDLGAGWGTTFDLEADFRYQANVAAVADGWAVTGFSGLSVGTFTRLDTNETPTWYDMEDAAGENGPAGETFRLAEDGWRIDNDNSSWVGRGWLTTNSDGSMMGPPAQDWFFTATVIPAPSGLALIGIGGIAACRRRR
jgi:hypothetical protein